MVACYEYGRAHGWEPVSVEMGMTIAGVDYVAQVWYDQVRQIIVWTEAGNWNNVRHFDWGN